MEFVFFQDKATEIKNAELTDEGYLHVPAKVGRTGILVYFKGDGTLDHLPEFSDYELGEAIPVLRDEIEAFDQESLKTYRHKVVTNEHPPIGLVDSSSTKAYQVGFTKGSVQRVGDTVKLGLVVTDQSTIRDIQSGKRQISMGYRSKFEIDAGVHPVYGAYKAKQTQIRCNHIAIVKTGRAGPEIAIGDAKTKGKVRKMPDEIMNLHRRTVGGVTVSFSDQGAEVVDQMATKVSVLETAVEDAESRIKEITAERDKLSGELDLERSKNSDVSALDAAVKIRADIIANARRINSEIVTDGQPNIEIMKSALSKVSTVDFTDKSGDYVQGAFDRAIMDAEKGANRDAAGNGSSVVSVADAARKNFIEKNSGRR